MKTTTLILTCLTALATLPHASAAVVTTNLGEPTDNNGWGVQSSQWIGMSFTVGTDFPLWTLDSTDLRASANGPVIPDFTVELHADAGGVPGLLLMTFAGPNPTALGTYTFAAAPATTLTASTTYWITAESMSINGAAYSWVRTLPDSGADTGLPGWSIGNNVGASFDAGATWDAFNIGPSLLSISATPVPEPSVTLTGGLAVLGLLLRRRRA